MKSLALLLVCAFVNAAIDVEAQVPAPRSDTIVRIAGAPRYPGIATVVDVLTLGASSSSFEYLFNVVADILVTRNGAVWIVDSPARNPRIRVFDSTGKFVRAVGRHGDGPGEFRAPSAMAELPDGSIGVRDVLGHKINVYAANGEPTTTWKFPTRISGVLFGGDGLRADSAGNWFVYINQFEGASPAPKPTPFADGGAMVRFNHSGVVVDTISRPQLPAMQHFTLTTVGIPSRTLPFYHDLTPKPIWHFSHKGYMVSGVPSRYAIDLLIPPALQSSDPNAMATWRAGDPVLSIRRNVPLVTLSDAERNDRNALFADGVQHDHGAVVGPIPSVPRVKPAYHSFSI